MSTPDWRAVGEDGLPTHCLIPLDEAGRGPETDPAKIVRWQCWCLDPECPGPPLEPIIEGPVPYFSAPVIYFGRCPLGDYATGKVGSEREARRMTREHIDAKHGAP